MDSPPLPLPVGSPVCATKPGWTVWNKLGGVKKSKQNGQREGKEIFPPAVVGLVLAEFEKV